MGVTIKDIAKKVGVSTASVSLVLNYKKCRIADETKQRIFEAAKELNYVTKKEKSHSSKGIDGSVVAFIYPILHNELIEECISGVEKYASVYGCHVIQMYCSDSSEKCLEQIILAKKMGVDGLIVFPPSDINSNKNNARLGESLGNLGVPYLLIDKSIYMLFCDFVTADYKLCSGMATNYLISNGHNKIGILTEKNDMWNSQKHITGYKEELKLNGIDFDENLIFYYDSSFGFQNKELEFFIDKGVTGLISCNKRIFLEFYDYARKNRIIIGDDISIINIGEVREAECINPTLAYIIQPGKQMGLKAMEVVTSRINKVEVGTTKTHYFTPTLIRGDSVKKLSNNID